MYLILLGPPGTGKGTQAKLIADRKQLLHIATGDLFRAAVEQGTELGRRAKAYMDEGELVPDDLTITMLEERIAQPDAQMGVIFDGYPRTLQQAQALEDMLARRGKASAAALQINASDEELVRRLSGRWLCANCGEIFHEHYRPPKQSGLCDGCGGPLSQREDDQPDVVRTRLRRQRPPEELLSYYRQQEKLVDVNGEQDVAAVTRELLQAIENATPAVH